MAAPPIRTGIALSWPNCAFAVSAQLSLLPFSQLVLSRDLSFLLWSQQLVPNHIHNWLHANHHSSDIFRSCGTVGVQLFFPYNPVLYHQLVTLQSRFFRHKQHPRIHRQPTKIRYATTTPARSLYSPIQLRDLVALTVSICL